MISTWDRRRNSLKCSDLPRMSLKMFEVCHRSYTWALPCSTTLSIRLAGQGLPRTWSCVRCPWSAGCSSSSSQSSPASCICQNPMELRQLRACSVLGCDTAALCISKPQSLNLLELCTIPNDPKSPWNSSKIKRSKWHFGSIIQCATKARTNGQQATAQRGDEILAFRRVAAGIWQVSLSYFEAIWLPILVRRIRDTEVCNFL